VVALVVDGSLSSDSIEIREHIVQFYFQLYLERFSWRPKLDHLSFNFIGKRFEQSEVYEVVRNLNGDKFMNPVFFFFAPDVLGGSKREFNGSIQGVSW
jgi:hypothetical protein